MLGVLNELQVSGWKNALKVPMLPQQQCSVCVSQLPKKVPTGYKDIQGLNGQ